LRSPKIKSAPRCKTAKLRQPSEGAERKVTQCQQDG
jgi:hypothetical protein